MWEFVPASHLGELPENSPKIAEGWRRHVAGDGTFTPRLGHAASTWHGARSVMVHGGQRPDNSHMHADLLRLNVPEFADGAPQWEGVEAAGPAPGARNGHSLTAVGGGGGGGGEGGGGGGGGGGDKNGGEVSFYLFGGASDESFLADLHVLTCAGGAYTWTRAQVALARLG